MFSKHGTTGGMFAASALALAITCSGTVASGQTVAAMLAPCQRGTDFCNGYFEGIQTLMQINCQRQGPSELSIGWFPSVEAGRHAFALWAANNPEKRHWPFFHGVTSAFREAFPCDTTR